MTTDTDIIRSYRDLACAAALLLDRLDTLTPAEFERGGEHKEREGVRLTGKTEDGTALYMIAWRTPEGAEGRGTETFSRFVAEEECRRANTRFPHMHHWPAVVED